MTKINRTFSRTLGRKVWMSLTGLFLITFLVVHLLGNLQLLKFDGGQAFNLYSAELASNPLIKVVAYLLYFSILAHTFYAIILTSKNKAARPVGYAESDGAANSSTASRNMGILGTVVFVFIATHMAQFWFPMKFGAVPFVEYTLDGQLVKVKDIHTIVTAAFKEWWISGFYVVSMAFLGYHLSHGFQSAFQTLGLNHPKYTPVIKTVGNAFAIIVPLGFAVLPIAVYLFA